MLPEKLMFALRFMLMLNLAACQPRMSTESRESEYEKIMKTCPEGYQRACQEEYEAKFAKQK